MFDNNYRSTSSMASALSKRQQARNEQTLQELIQSVPGNNQCADCQTRNPGWASWNLGIFLCLRCATLHRKLGTHISKVKSISLDAWSNEHVEIMKKTGNVESNRKFNPQNVKPAMPIDVDEVDGVMERYIRQKYEKRQLEDASRPGTRQNTGSTSSVEDRPLPLPPKPSRKFGFGFRSASSPFGMSRSDKRTPTLSPQHTRDTPSPRPDKPSPTLALNETSDAFAAKLKTLREMGFTDDRRNASVLQSMNGSIDRSVDALTRLGDSRSTSTGPRRAVSSNNLNGISVVKPKPDPFEALDTPSQPQSHAVSQAAPQAAAHPAMNGTNPFLQTQQTNYAQPTLEQSFAGISIAQPQPQPPQQQQQPLFPHNTGPQPQQPAYQYNPFQQSFTPPPVPSMPPQYQSMVSHSPPPVQQPHSASAAFPPGGNPFLRSTQSQYFQSSNNPYNVPSARSVTTSQQVDWSTQSQPPQQQSWTTGQVQSPKPFLQQQYQRQQSPTASSNPFLQQQQQQQIYSQPSNQPSQPNYALYNQTAPFQPSYSQEAAAFSPSPHNPYQQPPRRADTSSILALYNLPQSTDTPSMPQRSVTMPVTLPNGGTVPPATQTMTTPITTTPSAASLSRANPFAATTSLAQAPPQHQPQSQAASQIQAQAQAPNPAVQGIRRGNPKIGDPSRESVDFVGLMNGRHSPDAFSGLSARFT